MIGVSGVAIATGDLDMRFGSGAAMSSIGTEWCEDNDATPRRASGARLHGPPRPGSLTAARALVVALVAFFAVLASPAAHAAPPDARRQPAPAFPDEAAHRRRPLPRCNPRVRGWRMSLRLARSGSPAAALACLVLFCAIAAPAAAESQPPAPTSVAVYSAFQSQGLDVLWSYPRGSFSSYWSYKLQWKSGNQEYDSSRELVIDWFSREHRRMLNSAALDQYRRIGRITGLTPGTEYTVRVVVVDPDGNASSPSPEATGTPQLTPDQGFNLVEDEIINRFENSSPWLRSTWNYLRGRAVTWNFLGGG